MAVDGTLAGLGTAATVTTIGSAVAQNIAKGRNHVAGITMRGIDPRNGTEVLPARSFQWWPESFTDSLAIGWQEKQIPGASHALMQWGSNPGRTISFEVKLTRHMKYREELATIGPGGVGLTGALLDPESSRNLPFNSNIPAGIAYLRAFAYPDYDDQAGGIAIPPPICLLDIPGHQLGEGGEDTIRCVMMTCDVTYLHSFENGRPRTVSVALGFKQIVQSPGKVAYRRRSELWFGEESPQRGAWNVAREVRDIIDADAGPTTG